MEDKHIGTTTRPVKLRQGRAIILKKGGQIEILDPKLKNAILIVTTPTDSPPIHVPGLVRTKP